MGNLIRPLRFLRPSWLVLAILAIAAADAADAEISTDGSAGPRVRLPGPDFRIGADLGTRAGRNLFHSFERFDLRTRADGTIESATFSGPDAVRNIISRVTGGARSDIDGTLRSTIPGADFYFINPSGVVFGPNAGLDVQGSFHASTADELRFADGTKFSARDPTASSFTVAAPEAFGFLGAEQGRIAIDGSLLELPPGETLSLTGGEIEIVGGALLDSTAGAVNLVSVGAASEVRPVDAEGSVTSFGSVRIDGGTVIAARGGGVIRVHAGTLRIEDRSLLDASTSGAQPADGVQIELTGDLTLSQSLVGAGAFGTGAAGGVVVLADDITLDGGQIDASALGQGAAGFIALVASGRVTMTGTLAPGHPGLGADGAILEPRTGVYAASRGTGPPGGIRIQAAEIALEGAVISGVSRGSAEASSLSLEAETIRISERGVISAETFGPASGGTITILAPVLLAVDDGFIGANSREGATGSSGQIVVTGGRLVFTNEGRIFNGTNSSGDAGGVLVIADTILIDGTVDHVPKFWTGITATAEAFSLGAGPVVAVGARQIEIVNGGRIAAASGGSGAAGDVVVVATETLAIRGRGVFGPSNISVSSEKASTLAGVGDIVVDAPVVELSEDGRIEAANAGLGSSGGVTVQARTLRLASGAEITAESGQVDAGDIVLLIGDLVDLEDSRITTSAAAGAGGGGNIRIDPRFVVLDGSELVANAERGAGGNISIVTDNFIATPDSVVNASSRFGIDGTVVISTPEVDLSGGLVVLEGAIVDAAPLRERCAARRDIGASSFTGVGRAGLPPSPDGPLASAHGSGQPGPRLASGAVDEQASARRVVTLAARPCHGAL